VSEEGDLICNTLDPILGGISKGDLGTAAERAELIVRCVNSDAERRAEALEEAKKAYLTWRDNPCNRRPFDEVLQLMIDRREG
jgi:hypothetical protein